MIVAVVVAVYTAFLFAQAKGRDFWQSPTLALHMLVHSIMAGAAALGLVSLLQGEAITWAPFLNRVMAIGIGVNLLVMLIELMTTHPTMDAHTTVNMILKGRYATKFYVLVVILGNVLPLLLILFAPSIAVLAVASVLVLAGILFTEQIWVEAPQRIPLT